MKIGGINVRIVRKGVKHLRLSVCPPSGEVVITAPLAMDARELMEHGQMIIPS